MIRVGLFGLGAIGREVATAISSGIPGISLAGAVARDRENATSFLSSLPGAPPFLPTAELIRASDLVLEAASQAALVDLAPMVLEAGKDLMVLSSGALLGRQEWVALAERRRCRILVPSGGIAGLDCVRAARVGEITKVSMETRKAPSRWKGAPYVVKHAIDLDAITAETLLFEGAATEACIGFPASVNVLATLSLAGIGPERTTIRIYAVPGLERNSHHVAVEGDFGRLRIEIENAASANPRTARLAYLSPIAMLAELGATLQVGT